MLQIQTKYQQQNRYQGRQSVDPPWMGIYQVKKHIHTFSLYSNIPRNPSHKSKPVVASEEKQSIFACQSSTDALPRRYAPRSDISCHCEAAVCGNPCKNGLGGSRPERAEDYPPASKGAASQRE